MTIYNEIIAYLRDVIHDTQWEGNVYTVGGCCRDSIMNLDIHDIDLAVTVPDGGVVFAQWLEEKGLLTEPPVLFKRYSTSRLHLKAFPQHEIEVVQTRKEKYTDHNSRNPEVVFGSIEEDCIRRDLTINSLYQNVTTGEMVDITGKAIDDIKNHRIRTPLDPDIIFDDDPVRILRTIRFATRLGWKIPSDILESMTRNSHRLAIIRMERIQVEFEKMLCGPDPAEALRLLRRTKALGQISVDICRTFRTRHEESGITLWDKILKDINDTPSDPHSRYAAMLRDIHLIRRDNHQQEEGDRKGRRKRSAASRILNHLRYKSAFIKEVKRHLPPSPGQEPLSPEERRERNRIKRRRHRHNRASRRAGGNSQQKK